MKRIKILALAAALALTFSGCAKTSSPSKEESSASSVTQSAASEPMKSERSASGMQGEQPETDVLPRVVALKGPTAMGMVKMMADSAAKSSRIERDRFRIESAPDAVIPAVTKGEADIFAVPSNLASVLYNKTKGQIQVLAINTLGVLHVVERGDSIKTIAELKGKTIVMSGQGAMPEYALNYLLEKSGLSTSDITIEWKHEHSEVLAALSADTDRQLVAVLPQPFVAVAQSKLEDLRDAIDLNETWDQIGAGETKSAMITGVVVVRKAFAEAHPEAVKAFLAEYKASVAYTNEHVEDAAQMIGSYDIVPAPIAKKAIPASHITFVEGVEMKQMLQGFYEVLFKQNPKAIGGKLPADDFYFGN